MKQNIDRKKVYIVIPAYNEGSIIGEVITDIKKHGYKNIIVVDDGSTDATFLNTKKKKVIALQHLINRGKGAATQTGLDAARLLGAEVVVTMDADGQHYAKDIDNMVKPILTGKTDVVLGSRLKNKKHKMPFTRFVFNHFANWVTFFFYGIHVTDSQSGFRAYSKKANMLIDTTMDRYEFESEVLHQIKMRQLKHTDVPIDVRYTKYSQSKYDGHNVQAQNFLNGLKMFVKMVIRSIMS